MLLAETNAAGADWACSRRSTNTNEHEKSNEIKTAPARGLCHDGFTGFHLLRHEGRLWTPNGLPGGGPATTRPTATSRGSPPACWNIPNSRSTGSMTTGRDIPRPLPRFTRPGPLLFLQSDAQEFDGFRSPLPDMTRREGDLTPERIIFQRYLERLNQRVAYVTNLLQSEKFDFTGHDVLVRPRESSAPANLDAARELWRQNVRAEYLQEKLAGKKPADIVAPSRFATPVCCRP
jgi:hypothetical protein